MSHALVEPLDKETMWHEGQWMWWGRPRCTCGAHGSVKAENLPELDFRVRAWFDQHVAGGPPQPVPA